MGKTLLITVKVVPRSEERKCILDSSKSLKCYVKSPPENGAANTELIKLLAKSLGLTQQDVCIVRGATSRTKIIELRTALVWEEILAKLGFEVQNALF